MEILYAILTLLGMAIFFAIWAIPILWGVRWAKRNRISPNWMLFGVLNPVFAWIAFAIVSWGGQIDKVGNIAVKWATGKVECPSCNKFNPMNNAFCAQCGVPTFKPVCPRCGENKIHFVGRVGNYVGWGVLLLVIGGSAANVGDQLGRGGATTWGQFLIVLIAAPLFVGATILFFMPLSKRTKRVMCPSCRTESEVNAVTAFRQLSA